MAQLQFKGKTFVQNHHLLVKYHELVPVKAKSLTDKVALHDNLIIHGDNLKALKALLPLYAGKIKCIYIDPPYNTGNEGWAYNDNVNSPMMQEWLGKVVDREDLTRHDKWLCMMMPRLKLLRELMTEDGAIFVSIDDNEVHHLRSLMDEIFGEANFIATIVWQKKQSPQSDAIYLSDMHDFILVYAKKAKENRDDPSGWQRNLMAWGDEQDARYSNPDNDPRGGWASSDATCNKTAEERPNLFYGIKNPNTGKVVWPTKRRAWLLEKSTFQRCIDEGRVWWGADGNNFPRLKTFKAEGAGGVVPSTWWSREDAGDNQQARRELRQVFTEEEEAFATPKPVTLIKRILQLASDKDSIVLDSFAGSAPTAQAVIEQNAEDGGGRRFILIECEDYADSITAERVRRVISGIPSAGDAALKKGFGGTFSFFKLGKAIELDTILEGDGLPSYEELARYVFYTATGEEFDDKAVNEKKHFIGESRNYQVFLFYEPNVAKLKNLALTLDMAQALPPLKKDKKRLVFAPTKFLDQDHLDQYRIDFAQLPFEIYELTR